MCIFVYLAAGFRLEIITSACIHIVYYDNLDACMRRALLMQITSCGYFGSNLTKSCSGSGVLIASFTDHRGVHTSPYLGLVNSTLREHFSAEPHTPPHQYQHCQISRNRLCPAVL